MEITVGVFLLLVGIAFVYEWIDSSLGMGYGTLLSPTLLLLGFDPIVAVPAVLLSQAFGGLTAAIFHYRLRNLELRRESTDLRVASMVIGFGLAAVILAAVVSVRIPRPALQTYIGLLVATMGLVLLARRGFVLSWNRMVWVGIVSAFNKGISGGGFGPVLTGGQVLAGQRHRNAVGVTTLAQAPICITGFFAYLIARAAREVPGRVLDLPFREFTAVMFSAEMLQWELLLALVLGAVLVAPFGAVTVRLIPGPGLQRVLGAAILLLGGWTLVQAWR